MVILNEQQPEDLLQQSMIKNSAENKSSEGQIAQLLKEKGIDDKEAMKALVGWTIEQEQQVEKLTESDAYVQFNLRRARLYFNAGLVEGALENFEDAQILARNLGMNKLAVEIAEEIAQKKL